MCFYQKDLSPQEYYVKGSNAFFLERAAISSLLFVIDNPPRSRTGSSLDITDLIVDLLNGCKTANLCKGSLEPHSTTLVATNFSINSDQRYIILYTDHPEFF